MKSFSMKVLSLCLVVGSVSSMTLRIEVNPIGEVSQCDPEFLNEIDTNMNFWVYSEIRTTLRSQFFHLDELRKVDKADSPFFTRPYTETNCERCIRPGCIAYCTDFRNSREPYIQYPMWGPESLNPIDYEVLAVDLAAAIRSEMRRFLSRHELAACLGDAGSLQAQVWFLKDESTLFKVAGNSNNNSRGMPLLDMPIREPVLHQFGLDTPASLDV